MGNFTENLNLGKRVLFPRETQTTEDMLSESPWCNDTVADLHFPRFFGTPVQ